MSNLPNRRGWTQLPRAVERALSQEAHLAKRLVDSGITNIRAANHSDPGLYYQAFFELSIGIERIGKLILALDCFLTHRRFPTDSEFRDATRSSRNQHDLNRLLAAVEEINQRNKFSVGPFPATPEVGRKILDFLSSFAGQDRYHNLSTLSTGGAKVADPVATWYSLVLEAVPAAKLRPTPKEEAYIAFSDYLDNSLFVIMRGETETGGSLTSLRDATAHSFVGTKLSVEGMLLLIHFLRYLSQIINQLSYALNRARVQAPHFDEFFYMWGNPDSYLRTRKVFTRGR